MPNIIPGSNVTPTAGTTTNPNAGRMSIGGQLLSSYSQNQPVPTAIGGGPARFSTPTPGSGGANTDAQGNLIAQGQTGAFTPTLNANITTPDATTKSPAPAVITSDKAQNDVANIGTNLTQAQTDAQTQASAKAAADAKATADATTKAQNTQTATPSPDDQISSLIASLTTDSTANQNQANATEDTLLSQEAQNQSDQATAYQNMQSAFDSIRNGTYPLTGAEQAVLSATQQQFQSVIQLQQTANQAYTGQMKEAMASLGIDTSAPTQAMGNIQDTITSGNMKIGDLNTQMTLALSNATVAFQKQAFDELQTQWSNAAQQFQSRQTTLQDMLSTVTAQAKNAQDEINTRATMGLTAIMDSNTMSFQDKQLALQKATLDEKTRDDMQKDLIAEFTAGMTGPGGNGSGGVTPATVGSDGKVDPASQANVYNSYVQAYGSATANLIKGLSDYSVNPADWKSGATKGMSRATAVSLAKALDPTYDDSQYNIRAAYKKGLTSTASGSTGVAINSANKAINHLTAFVNSMSQIGNDSTTLGNWIGNNSINLLDPTRRTAIATAQTEGTGVADELAKFFKGTGATDVGSIEAWKSQISPNAPPSDVKGLTQGAITLLAGQLETLSEQYQNTMGQPPPDNLLGTSAMKNLSDLKNQGYTVDIPGVQYTDKDAYIKSDPNAQSNMTAAITQLTNAGLPVTPENILQLAQEQ